MASRLKVPLAVLFIFGITYVGTNVDHFSGFLWNNDVQQKVANSTSGVNSTFSFANNATNSLSPLPPHSEMDQLNGQGGYTTINNTDNVTLHYTLDKEQHDPTHASGNVGSESEIIQPKTGNTNTASPCCLRPSTDVAKRLTPRFFEIQRTNGIDPKTKWTGKEYEEWVAILERLNPNHTQQTNLDCTTQYSLMVLEEVSGFYLRAVLTELGQGSLQFFPYFEERLGLPRILLLGDSISRGIRNSTQWLYHEHANIHGAPNNAMGFSRYETGLKHWLGHCPWDLVHFNVGMHFHPKYPEDYTSWRSEYIQGITNIVKAIQKHSPSAHIVFGLTTPSPFDSNATTPNRATCPHYNKFHKAGFVPEMNKVAKSVAKKLGIIINDRHSFILPVLEKYQIECDVHYTLEGYQLLAQQDWKVMSTVLAINDTRRTN